MQITRELPIVTEEENDQYGVTLAIGTTEVDLEPGEARQLGFGLIKDANAAEEHLREVHGCEVARVASQRHGFDVDEGALRGGIEL